MTLSYSEFIFELIWTKNGICKNSFVKMALSSCQQQARVLHEAIKIQLESNLA